MADAGLVCSVRFRKGYVAVQRSGGYNVLVVDLYWKQPVRLALKIPDDPDALGLSNPYPELATTWTPTEQWWAWTVPTADQVPDIARLMPLVRRFHYPDDRAAAGSGAAGEPPPS